jgi:gas vesicle protein
VGKDPDQLRRDIEATRYELGQDVDALNEKVNPARIVSRRTDRARSRLARLRVRVMGTASDTTATAKGRFYAATDGAGGTVSSAGSATSDKLSTAGDRVSAAGERVGDTVTSAAQQTADTAREVPTMVRQRTEGNPLAAGLIAFGTGWLVASLLPPTEAEKRASQAALEQAEPLKEKARETAQEVAQEMKGNLQEPAREAAETVRERAAEAKDSVQQETRGAATEVRDKTKAKAQKVRDETKSAAQDVRDGTTSSGPAHR